MERKKSQLLFNFLPEDTFNHARNGTIGRVAWIYKDRQSRVEDLPINYILQRIRPRVKKWPNDVPLRPSSVEIISPDGATFEIFPRVFECRRCDACTSFSENYIQSGRTPQCGHCDRSFDDTEQLQFVVVCPCGTIDSVRVPSCNSCGYDYPRFARPTSQMGDAFWECLQCDSYICDAYDPLNNCNYCGQPRRIKVHSSSTTFYPQLEKFVNITDEDLEYITNSEQYQKDVITDYLLGEDTATDPDNAPDIDPEMLERLGISEDEYREEMEEYEAEQAEERREVEQWVDENLGEDQREVSEEIFEFNSLTSNDDIDDKTISELFEEAADRDDLNRPIVDEYVDARDRLNIDSVRLITDFPITTVVYGYSRLEAGPNEDSQLNTFYGKDGNDRMFAQTAEAEAVMFTLDPEHVFQWLLNNGVVDAWPEMDLNRWFVKNLTQYPYFEEIDPSNSSLAARHTLSLVHTLSHTMMNAVDALSGYSKDSLVEYLLPHTLSFVIYKHSDTDFSLGAMHTLIEDRFLELVDYVESDADMCMYDPVCEEEENGACEDCLYISNISCDNGNHNLGRATIYGGQFDGRDIAAFVDTEVQR